MTEIKLFNTPEHVCPYLADELATTQFVNPDEELDIGLYTFLGQHGFRRSGDHIYRPVCQDCDACRSIRVVVDEFTPSRNHKRCLNKAGKFQYTITKAHLSPEHYALYEQYIEDRHFDGDMYPASQSLYEKFLFSQWSRTHFLEIRDENKLIACGVFDQLLDGLSAVYSYFDTDYASYSLGKLTILKQIEYAQSAGLGYLYLGFQIDACQKMNYKTQYKPIEQLMNNKWQRI